MSKMGEMVMEVEEMFSANATDSMISKIVGLSEEMIAKFRVVYEDSESHWDSFDADRPDR